MEKDFEVGAGKLLDLQLDKAQQSRWLRRSRRSLKFDVKAFAQRLDVSCRTINAWENESNPNLPSRDKVLVYLMLMIGRRNFLDPNFLVALGQPAIENQHNVSSSDVSRVLSELNPKNREIATAIIDALLHRQVISEKNDRD